VPPPQPQPQPTELIRRVPTRPVGHRWNCRAWALLACTWFLVAGFALWLPSVWRWLALLFAAVGVLTVLAEIPGRAPP